VVTRSGTNVCSMFVDSCADNTDPWLTLICDQPRVCEQVMVSPLRSWLVQKS